MFEWANDRGYPHPNLFLRQMTAYETAELYAFLNMKADRVQQKKDAENESKLEAFFDNQNEKFKRGEL